MILFESERSGKLFQKVLELAGIFCASGGRALLVGGAVRDALLGRSVKDFDLEIHNLSADRVKELLQGVCEVDAVGVSFGVIKVKHLELDISLPRRENKTGRGHRGFLVEVDPQLSIADAAARRDFTVNAIMYDPLSDEILDPHGGVKDLEKKVLRHVSSHFSEDPLRVLRGMQFAARTGFAFAPETIELCSQISQEELAVERIGTEWEKMLLQGKFISRGLDFLKECRWISFYPELENLSQEEWHKTLLLLDNCAGVRPEDRQEALLFMSAALVSELSPEHARRFCLRLWNRNELINKIVALAAAFGEQCKGAPPDDSGVRRLALRLEGVKQLSLLLQAAGLEEKAAGIAEKAHRYGLWQAAPKPLLTGKHGIKLGVKPGKELGILMKQCFEAQLDGLFFTEEEGIAYLETLLS
ncbi:MAG: CCA tRNA nucleotidyltransferase [Lentisphaeria bacterium]|nr:CCA tRNA nucleotidyltransferase [Lentisphaeria bacterium]